jgi:hypothetical protein
MTKVALHTHFQDVNCIAMPHVAHMSVAVAVALLLCVCVLCMVRPRGPAATLGGARGCLMRGGSQHGRPL